MKMDYQHMYYFHFDPDTQTCQYRFSSPVKYKLLAILIILPFLVFGLLAGVTLTSGGLDKVVPFSPLTYVGVLLSLNAGLVSWFGLIAFIRISYKKYRHTEIYSPAFDGLSKNLAAFIIVTLLYVLGFVYLWLPNLPRINPNNRLYMVPIFLLLPGILINMSLAAMLNRLLFHVSININHTNETVSLNLWSMWGKYRSVRFPLADPVRIIKKNFLYKTREDTEFPGSKVFAAIVEHNGLRYLVFWNSEVLCDAFISELRQCTGWQVTEEEAGFIERDSYEWPL